MANWFAKLFNGDKQDAKTQNIVTPEVKESNSFVPKAVNTSFITNPDDNSVDEKTEMVYSLTDREGDVFHFLLMGYTIKQTAENLGISYSTVNTHMNSVYRKLKVNSKSQLILNYHDFL